MRLVNPYTLVEREVAEGAAVEELLARSSVITSGSKAILDSFYVQPVDEKQ